LSDDGSATPAGGLPQQWLRLALDPPRAHDGPAARGRLRVSPEDFCVDELLGFEASGVGQHVLLRVRKRGANTEHVARELARVANCKPFDVGFAGLKDRHAVTTQYFTVPRGRAPLESWLAVQNDEFAVLSATAHDRKLPRGALRANRFTIVVRSLEPLKSDLALQPAVAARLDAIAQHGVPNYFGSQRFGRDAGNLRAALIGQLPRSREQRSFALSAARSLLFNAVLARRVTDGTWASLGSGDVANLDGSGSVFKVTEVSTELITRLAQLDTHPTGPLWGDGESLASGETGALESNVASEFPQVIALLAQERLRAERRALRIAVHGLRHEWLEANALRLEFELVAGSFATTVLSEVVECTNGSAD
jgi:tRNA pseudouridine13 synthase